MEISNYMGYSIYIPTSGGKAGKGHAVTGSVQVRASDFIIKQFRFKWAIEESRKKALSKARKFIDDREQKNRERQAAQKVAQV